MAAMKVDFSEDDTYYRGYGLEGRKDGTCLALSDTPDLHEEMDYMNIGFGGPVDRGRSYTVDKMKKRIDEVIADRQKRIGWVKEFSQTCKKPDWAERYLLQSCDPNNKRGHMRRSNHTEAELYHIWTDDWKYYMRSTFGYVETSRTKYLYRKFLIEKGYIEDKK